MDWREANQEHVPEAIEVGYCADHLQLVCPFKTLHGTDALLSVQGDAG